MNHEYRAELYAILSRKPAKGLPLGTIARLVYNSRVSLFASGLSYEIVYSRVAKYLYRQSKKKDSPFVHAQKWGHYTIKKKPNDYPTFL